MSNLKINIRIWYWHLQLTTENIWSWKINRYIYENHRKTLWKRPFSVREFRFLELLK